MRSLLAFGGISLVLSSIGIPAIGQEVQPVTVVDAEVSIVYPGEEIKAVPRIASGTVRRPEGCDFCYLHDTQYRIEIPEGSIGLVIELENLSDPRGDIDLIVREGEPVSEDETSYYYSYRTYEDGGFERLDLPELGGESVPVGSLYIGIVSFVEDGAEFELRAAVFQEEPLPDARRVDASSPEDEIVAGRSILGDLSWQYAVDVPEGAGLLAVRVTADSGNVTLSLGRRPIRLDVRGEPVAEIQLLGRGADQFLLLDAPTVGRYWFAVANPGLDPVRCRIVATPVPEISLLPLDVELVGSIGWEDGQASEVAGLLATPLGQLGLIQYRAEIPPDATTVRLSLGGPDAANLGLHVRFGQPVLTSPSGVIADLSLTDGTEKGVRIGRDLLVGDVMYVAIERLARQGEFVLSLVAEVESSTR